MNLNKVDLIVPDVPSAAHFFQEVVGLTPTVLDDRFAEIPAGAVTLMLSPDAMVPVRPAAGLILHFETDDVPMAEAHARSMGIEVLQTTMTTDWGWESCLVQGPADCVIDFYRSIPTADQA